MVLLLLLVHYFAAVELFDGQVGVHVVVGRERCCRATGCVKRQYVAIGKSYNRAAVHGTRRTRDEILVDYRRGKLRTVVVHAQADRGRGVYATKQTVVDFIVACLLNSDVVCSVGYVEAGHG